MTTNPEHPAPDSPDMIWITGTQSLGAWNDGPLTMPNPPKETQYTRTDLYDAALARIAELESKFAFAVEKWANAERQAYDLRAQIKGDV